MDRRGKVSRYRTNLQNEIDSASLYRALAEVEPQPQLAELYRRMASVEEKHGRFWQRKLRDMGEGATPPAPSPRSRLLGWLGKRFGPQFVLPAMARMDQIGQHMYDAQTEAHDRMRAQERSHARLLRAIEQTSSAGLEGNDWAQFEGRHKAVGGNALRASVLGASDGLTTNLSLIMGVAGTNLSMHGILATGFAGLLSGACSMAIGEWISVQSSREY